MGTTMPEYDPRIIERHASKLYAKASAVVAGSAATGGFVGAAFGAVPLTSLGVAWPVPSAFGFATLLFGLIAGLLVGYVVGDARSFGYRLQAQSALCQIQLERNMAQAARALEAFAPPRPTERAEAAGAPQPIAITVPDDPGSLDLGLALPPVSPRYGS